MLNSIPEARLEPVVDEDGLDTGEWKLTDGTQVVCVEPGCPLVGMQDIFISINDTVMPTFSANLYQYQAYWHLLYESSAEARATTLKEHSMFIPKEPGLHSELDPRPASGNQSLAYLYSLCKGGKLCQTLTPLISPASSFTRALPPNTKISVTLDRQRPTIYILSTNGNDSVHYELIFKSVYLLVKRVELPEASLSAYNSLHARSPISFPYVGCQMSSHEIPPSTLNFDFDVGGPGLAQPSLIRFGLVKHKAFLGTYNQSSFAFERGGLRSIRLREADGTISQEFEYFQPAEDSSGTDVDPLTFLATSTPLSYHHFMRIGTQISRRSFNHGYAVVRLDLSRAHVHDTSEDEGPLLRSTPKLGRLTVCLEWAKKTQEAFDLVIEEQFDKGLSITKTGEVIFT
jgi:hypothetical protein